MQGTHIALYACLQDAFFCLRAGIKFDFLLIPASHPHSPEEGLRKYVQLILCRQLQAIFGSAQSRCGMATFKSESEKWRLAMLSDRSSKPLSEASNQGKIILFQKMVWTSWDQRVLFPEVRPCCCMRPMQGWLEEKTWRVGMVHEQGQSWKAFGFRMLH